MRCEALLLVYPLRQNPATGNPTVSICQTVVEPLYPCHLTGANVLAIVSGLLQRETVELILVELPIADLPLAGWRLELPPDEHQTARLILPLKDARIERPGLYALRLWHGTELVGQATFLAVVGDPLAGHGGSL